MALGFRERENLRFDLTTLSQFAAPKLDRNKQWHLIRNVSMAAHLYCRQRAAHVGASRALRDIRSYAHKLERVVSPTERMGELHWSQLDVASGARTRHERLMGDMLLSLDAARQVLTRHSASGHPIDAPGHSFVLRLATVYASLTCRAPLSDFDSMEDSLTPDDVSTNPFGRFVQVVEDIVVAGVTAERIMGMDPRDDIGASRYRIPNKRSAIRWAIGKHRRRNPLQIT